MSAYIRSLSMNMKQDGSGDAPLLRGNGHNLIDSSTSSPLQVFVQAKKSINDIFTEIEDYIKETCQFIKVIPPKYPILTEKEAEEINNHAGKVKGIREVLTRNHMKVAFFGRTSNGKSTVINAMLRDKILPSGIGHTTSCFLQVEGAETPGEEPYLIIEDIPGKQNVKSVGQLGHALCNEKLTESALVKIYWPREKCPLLRDDVVFVDSPGIDVSPNLDDWIDKHCLDADVFVLVANAESTLMVTEKNFFHKVSTRLSKPNIFILNNRWDASANEPDLVDQVRAQHMERTSDFLVKELKVSTKEQVAERIFFVSAKEALNARLQELKGLPAQTGAVAEGFTARYFEFQDFERKFEECISKSAVKTKFEQHSQRGKLIAGETKQLLDQIQTASTALRQEKTLVRKELWDKIDFTDKQLQLLTQEMKDKIRQMVEDVEGKVSKALSEEIRRLGVLVDEFNASFHADDLVLNVYKKELHSHVEAGLGSNLRARLSTALALNMESSQKEMTERMSSLLPQDKKVLQLLPRREPFEVLYRLNCDNLCSDFREDLRFKFSFGIAALFNRFLGVKQGKGLSMFGMGCGERVEPIPRGLPHSPMTPPLMSDDSPDWSLISRVAVASVTSQGTMGVLLVAGMLLKTVGWRVIAVTGVIYGGLYMYERLTWTNKAKEREFKRQYVEHATKKLRLIVDLTSANCSHQVQQELSSTFARLCHLVDSSTCDMESDMKMLEQEIHKLNEIADGAKVLKNKANYLVNELDLFDAAFLKNK